MKNGVKKIQTAGYNGARTVNDFLHGNTNPSMYFIVSLGLLHVLWSMATKESFLPSAKRKGERRYSYKPKVIITSLVSSKYVVNPKENK